MERRAFFLLRAHEGFPMASVACIGFLKVAALVLLLAASVSSSLSPDFYSKACPQALPVIRQVVEDAVRKEPRMGASLLRLHFHDCFVNGCDGSVLLDDTANFTGEKTAGPNANSARGFEVIDNIKAAVNKACGPVVSCADILAVAARDSVVALGGPTWDVQLGRRDARDASKDDANTQIPGPFSNLTTLLYSFQTRGMNLTDLVVLSAAHTIGQARCILFRRRIYNEYNIDFNFARSLQPSCPSTAGDGDGNLAPLDHLSPNQFGFNYFMNLLMQRGLLHSDQELYNGGPADNITKHYALNPTDFYRDFAKSMLKMQNVSVLTGNHGEVRLDCRKVNS
ncbi:Peroxidase 20 [Nymphaea thermarum]|nr:Peroxidase 20 [Nymphaea thermarum]